MNTSKIYILQQYNATYHFECYAIDIRNWYIDEFLSISLVQRSICTFEIARTNQCLFDQVHFNYKTCLAVDCNRRDVENRAKINVEPAFGSDAAKIQYCSFRTSSAPGLCWNANKYQFSLNKSNWFLYPSGNLGVFTVFFVGQSL